MGFDESKKHGEKLCENIKYETQQQTHLCVQKNKYDLLLCCPVAARGSRFESVARPLRLKSKYNLLRKWWTLRNRTFRYRIAWQIRREQWLDSAANLTVLAGAGSAHQKIMF